MTQEQLMEIEKKKEDPFKQLEQEKLKDQKNKVSDDIVTNDHIEDGMEEDEQQNPQLEEKKKSYKLEHFDILITREDNGCIHEGIYPKDHIRKCEIINIIFNFYNFYD